VAGLSALAVLLGVGGLVAGPHIWSGLTGGGQAQGLLPAQPGPARQREVAARVAGLRVVSYYPAADGWTRMWTNWQPAVIRRDFARIHALGANAVRVVAFPLTFGWPTPSHVMAARFADVLAMAKSNGLGVQLTLFDLWGSYDEVAGSQAWLRSLLQPYASNPEIRLVELKNEVDPGSAAEVHWLRALLPTLRSVLPGTPSTVSVPSTPGPSGFTQLRRELRGVPLDVADIHFYGSEQKAYGWMLAAKRAAGPLPLFVGEAGSPVEGGPAAVGPVGPAAADLDQAHWFSVVFTAARAAGIPPPAPWTLNDFTPGTVPGGGTGVSQQNYFGLYTLTGQQRPAALVVRQAFSGRSASTSNLGLSLSGGDWEPMIWSPFLPDQGILAYDPRVGHLRPGSVRLSDTRISQRGAPSFFLVPANPAIPGQLWSVSAWATGTHVNGTAELALGWFDSHGSYLGASSSAPLPRGNPGWTQLLVRTQVPAGAVSVQVHLKSFGVAGTVWFAGVSIAVSARSAGGPPPATQSPTPATPSPTPATPSPTPTPPSTTGVPLGDGEESPRSSAGRTV
jgi:hypothetical protein